MNATRPLRDRCMRCRPRAVLAAALFAMIALPSAFADRVVLVHGHELEGVVVAQDAETVTLRTVDGEITLPRTRIAKIVPDGLTLQEVERRAAAARAARGEAAESGSPSEDALAWMKARIGPFAAGWGWAPVLGLLAVVLAVRVAVSILVAWGAARLAMPAADFRDACKTVALELALAAVLGLAGGGIAALGRAPDGSYGPVAAVSMAGAMVLFAAGCAVIVHRIYAGGIARTLGFLALQAAAEFALGLAVRAAI